MTESQFVTSETDIRRLLRSCAKCASLTKDATLIITHTELPDLTLDKIGSRKYSIIINSESDSRKLGHWFTLLVFPNRRAILCDSLNRIFEHKHIRDSLKTFCAYNNLTLHNLGFHCQHASSKKCGYITLFFTAKTSILTYFQFMKLIRALNRGSVRSRENYIITFVAKHYNILI